MAHDIATINGKSAIAYVGETPWHRLGTVLGTGVDLHTALAAANLNWDVEARPAFIIDSAGVQREIPAQGVVRCTDGRVLGTVGPRYEPIQHRDAFRAFEDAIKQNILRIDVLGALGDGETVWMLLKIATEQEQSIRTLKSGRPDIVRPYLNVSTAHDGSRSLCVDSTSVRVVCRNTLQMSDACSIAKVSIRHTQSATDQLSALTSILGAAVKQYRESVEMFRKFAACQLSEKDLLEYIAEVIPMPAKPRGLVQVTADESRDLVADLLGDQALEAMGRELTLSHHANEKALSREIRWKADCAQVDAERAIVAELMVRGAGNEGSSLWDGYNAVTELVDHTARRETAYARERAAISAIDGPGAAMKARAYNIASKYVSQN